MASVSRYGKGISGLWKQAWCEIPEIMTTGCLVIIGIPFGLHGLYRIEKEGLEKRRYRFDYIVYRHDDPRVTDLPR